MPALQRRRTLELLASGGLASLAGCSTGPRDRDAPECEARMGLRLRETSEEEIVEETDRPPEELQPLARALVRAARVSGTATYDSARWWPPDASDDRFPGSGAGGHEPFPISLPGDPRHRYVHLSDGYYRMIVDRGQTAETTVYGLVWKTNPTVNADARSGETITFDALPTHDQQAVLAAIGSYGTQQQDVEFGRLWGIGYLQDGHVESSLLVPRPSHEYIEYRDWFLQVEPTDTSRESRAVYDLSLDHAADTTTEFATAVRQTDGVDLDVANLSADQRELLDEATERFVWACMDDSSEPDEDEVVWVDRGDSDKVYPWPALEDLFETIGAARYVNHDGTWYTRHERPRA